MLSRTTRAGLAGLVALLVVVGCSDDVAGPVGGAPTAEAGAGSPVASESEAAPPEPTEPGPVCAPGDGRTVEMLPDVVVPPTTVEPVVDEVSGEVVAEGFAIPEQVADAGCVVHYDAPGGCVGAVDITAATIPGVVIPQTIVPSHVYPEVSVPPVTQPGVHADEVCQVAEQGSVPTVTRPGVVREGFSRNGVARPGDALVPTVHLEPVRLPDVDVEPVRLSRRELPDGVAVLDGDRRTSYVAPAQVLFDSDSATLRGGASRALRAIVTAIRAETPGARLLVEGHTDDRGDAAYGMRLSEHRAAAVATWLVGTAGLDGSLISTRGYGETRPAYPNDSSAHRQLNRRVVITVLP